MEMLSGAPALGTPVYPGYFADPFAWEHRGKYYAIGTGETEASSQPAKMIFPLLESDDFFEWRPAGHAMIRPEASLGDTFWAPEVVRVGDSFLLYYSVGFGDKNHQIRVASSESPLGPYQDLGKTLCAGNACPFAIDAHPFRDDDGQWYLFYATDFLDTDQGMRAGTALQVDRLVSMTELAGTPQLVVRARHDWQRYKKDRPMYGGVYDWHTIEGATVRKHEGRYYCFYSAGCWENNTYGVDYAVAESVLGPYINNGCASGPRVLQTIPGKLIGPGHNSIVSGPDGHDYIVFHAWDNQMKARQMHIARLQWSPAGPRLAIQ